MLNRKSKRRNTGLSLIELLVALALGVMLCFGVTTIYLENISNYQQNEELARLQENGRFALKMLKRELSMAGFVGDLANKNGIASSPVGTDCVAGVDWALDTSDPIELVNNFASSVTTLNGTTLTCVSASEVQAATDIISVKRTADSHTLKDGEFNTGLAMADQSQWYLRSQSYGGSNSWSYIGASGSIPVADATPNSLVDYWEYYAKILFIRQYSQTTGDDIPTLCMASLVSDAMTTNCYVEGVEDMQIEVGIDSDADGVPDLFKPDPTSAEIDSAVAIRVYLLVRSIFEDHTYVNTKTYKLGGKDITAFNDNYYRRVFSMTVVLQNRNLT